MAKFLAIYITRFIKECKVIDSFNLSEWWTKAPVPLIITLVTNLPTQGVGLSLWIHEEYLLAIFSKMLFPRTGISHQSSLSAQLFIIMYSELLYSLHLLHKWKSCMILPLRNCAKYQQGLCAIYKFFMNMWTWIMKNFYFIFKNDGIFLYEIKWNIPIEISKHLNFKLPLSLKWMCIQF